MTGLRILEEKGFGGKKRIKIISAGTDKNLVLRQTGSQIQSDEI